MTAIPRRRLVQTSAGLATVGGALIAASALSGSDSDLQALERRYWRAHNLANVVHDDNEADVLLAKCDALAARMSELPAKTGVELAARIRVLRHMACIDTRRDIGEEEAFCDRIAAIGFWTAAEDAEKPG